MTRHVANFEVSSLGGVPYSMKDYTEIEVIPKLDISKKRGNFDKLRAWMNDSLPFHYLRVGEGENLLAFARLIERWNDGARPPAEIMRHGKLTSRSATIICHILYANPKIGWASFLLLFNQFFVLIVGRPARED